MTTLSNEELLKRVKDSIGMTGNYHDAPIKEHINEVKTFLASAGVRATVLNSDKAVGTITRGVMDLWNYGAGEGTLSPYFYQRVIQLRFEPEEQEASE